MRILAIAAICDNSKWSNEQPIDKIHAHKDNLYVNWINELYMNINPRLSVNSNGEYITVTLTHVGFF